MGVSLDDLFLPPSRPSITRRDMGHILRSCCDSCSLVVLGLILTIPTVFLFFLFVNTTQEKIGYGEIPTMKIDSITVSSFNLSNPIYALWNINMNMHSSYTSYEFSDSTISIFHKSKEEALWMTRLKGFDMRPENTRVHFALDFGGSVDVNDTIVRAIGDDITNNHGAVELNVQFKADHARSRDISRLNKFFCNYATTVNMFISCDLFLIFGCPDKTRAYMLMTKNQARYYSIPQFHYDLD